MADTVGEAERASVELYWLPLGAGGRFVRWNGRVFDAVAARMSVANRATSTTPPWRSISETTGT